MLAYSTNPNVRTQYSVKQEREAKAKRIASEVRIACRRDVQKWIEDGNNHDLEMAFRSDLWNRLNMNKGNNCKRLHNLYEAVLWQLCHEFAI